MNASLPPQQEPARPSRVSRHWIETLLSLLAVVIAASSLWVAMDTERTNEQLVAEAAWPYLQIYNSAHDSDGKPLLSLNISNTGIGPAKIETLEVFWQGKPYRTSQDLLKACCSFDATSSSAQRVGADHALSNSEAAGTVLRAGDSIRLIAYARTAGNDATYDAFDAAREKIAYRLCYCSVFNECWLTSGHDLNAPRVTSCPAPAVPYFE